MAQDGNQAGIFDSLSFTNWWANRDSQ